MIIYVRHSDDEGGDCSKKLDCNLVEDGARLASKVGKKLIKKYGVPDVVYFSPFRRTKGTMKNMLRGINLENTVLIEEPRLSRYFVSGEKSNPDIDISTYMSNIPIEENRKEFSLRIEKFASSLKRNPNNKKIVIWCITHTTVYKKLGRIYNVDIPHMIPFMSYFVV